MSETETEAQETPEQETAEPNPDTQETPDTGPEQEEPGTTEEGGEQESPEEPIEEPEQPEARAFDERAAEIRSGKLQNENVRHARRVSEIMEDDSTDLIPCPVCMGGIAGWIFPPEVQTLAPEAISRIRTVIGLPDYTTFKQSPDYRTCDGCDGLGEVITGSKVPGFEVQTCLQCNKQGFLRVGLIQNGHVTEEYAQIPTGPQVYANDESSDPEIQHLRERGFTVIPPMNLPATAG